MNNINISKAPVNNRAIIYARVSSKNQLNGDSIDMQLSNCKDYCSKNNLIILNEYSESKSARDMKDLQILLHIIENNENINIIIWEPTRFSRNPIDYHNILPILNKKNIILHFPQKKLISNNNNDIKIISNFIYDGQIESETLSNRLKNINRFKKLHNIPHITRPKYGFKYCKIQKKNIIDDSENLIIQLIKKMYNGSPVKLINKLLIAITENPSHKLYDMNDPNFELKNIEKGNLTIKDIAEFLNYVNITKKEKIWTQSKISQILKYSE
jgi:DNA invertase Pin-like site-specific DNA recombinase